MNEFMNKMFTGSASSSDSVVLTASSIKASMENVDVTIRVIVWLLFECYRIISSCSMRIFKIRSRELFVF